MGYREEGIVSSALATGFGALADVGKQWMQHLNATDLQERAADIQRLRDERLTELRGEEAQTNEDIRRAPGIRAGERIKASESEMVDDPSGTVRKRNAGELADERSRAYQDEGLVTEAQREREHTRSTEKDKLEGVNKNQDNARQERHEDILQEHYRSQDKNAGARANRPGAQPKTFATEDGYLAHRGPDGVTVYEVDEDGEYVRAPQRPGGGGSAGEVTPRVQLASLEKELRAKQTELAGEYMPADKARIKGEIADLERRRESLRGGAEDQGKTAPPKNGWNSESGAVMVNGQVIPGTARTREAAQELRRKFLANQK